MELKPAHCHCITAMARHRCRYASGIDGCEKQNQSSIFTITKPETMDHFLFAYNPLKTYGPTGIAGYIIDTVKGTWIAVDMQPKLHTLQLIKSSGSQDEDVRSCMRASRWYNSWLIQQGIEVDVQVYTNLPTQKQPHEPRADT
jgi:hypothetical protein